MIHVYNKKLHVHERQITGDINDWVLAGVKVGLAVLSGNSETPGSYRFVAKMAAVVTDCTRRTLTGAPYTTLVLCFIQA